MKKKVLLYVHDGSGLGHLRRISRIAAVLQESCATLIVTGHRSASWIVPGHCEFVHLPSWDNLTKERAKYWGREPWLDYTLEEAIKLKSELFLSIVKTYAPDAILVDYLPFGKYNEIEAGLRGSGARKYLIHRGIIDTLDKKSLCGEASKHYADVYDRILVAADERIVDFIAQGSFDVALASKVEYVGYVTPNPDSSAKRAAIRIKKGIMDGQQWVVCSSGGGIKAEHFLNKCIEAAKAFPKVHFDVVFGPRSKEDLITQVEALPNVTIKRQAEDLPELLGACDVAISNGGYNSLMEAIIGGTQVIVHPNQSGESDEQLINAMRLKKYYPITLLENEEDLIQTLSNRLEQAHKSVKPIFSLNTCGLANIDKIIKADIGI